MNLGYIKGHKLLGMREKKGGKKKQRKGWKEERIMVGIYKSTLKSKWVEKK